MAWNFSTEMQEMLLAKDTTFDEVINITGSTVTFTATQILDSGNGLGDANVGDFITVAVANTPGNVGIKAKVLTAAIGELTFESATFTIDASASPACIIKVGGGSLAEVMQNGTLHLYSTPQPTNADAAESGTLLAKITLNGGAMVASTSTNGVNLGNLTAAVLKRAIDPATGVAEIWSGDGEAAAGTGTAAYWGRWYANDIGTGAATDKVRADGTVTTTSGGDIVMESGLTIASGVPAVVSEITISVS